MRPIDRVWQDRSICQRDDATVCIDQATLGGFGSAVTYTGFGDVFLAVPDRGPFDGRTDVPYLDRFHFLHITVDPTRRSPTSQTVLLDTRFLKDERQQASRGRRVRVRHQQPRALDAVRSGRCGRRHLRELLRLRRIRPLHLRVRPSGASAAADSGARKVPARSRRPGIRAATSTAPATRSSCTRPST